MAQWDQLTSYPRDARAKNESVTEMLDELETLQPPLTDIEDRYSAFTDFLERGVAAGLITPNEEWLARITLSTEM